MSDVDREKEYYRAAAMQGKGKAILPPYLPTRVRVTQTVTADIPGTWETRVIPGEYDCDCNPLGAISVQAKNGKMLGLKPSEFEVLEWEPNPRLQETS